ncbi:MAG: transglycosylase SLT domain-containing protein [Deltaproteobacteria bacterium]|nr:transglycosylase SLT domain-containing protein [Deltaproteobacteria bacterium]
MRKILMTGLLFLAQPVMAEEPLPVWSTLRLVSNTLDQFRHKEALELLEKLPPDPEPLFPFWRDVLRARALLGLGKPGEALTLLETLPFEPDIEKTPNQNFYRTLIKDALEAKMLALDKTGKNSVAVQSKIWGLFPDFDPPFPIKINVEDKLNRLHVLYVKKLPQEIPTFLTLEEIAAYQGPKKCLALVEWGGAMKELKNVLSALGGFEKAAALHCPEDIDTRALFWKGKLEWGMKNYPTALSTWQTFLKTYPNHRYSDDAAYAIWKIHEATGQKVAAHQAREKFFNFPGGDVRARELWEMGYDLYKKKEYSRAISWFDKMLAPAKPDAAFPQALYWKSRSLEKMGKTKEGQARTLYQKLTRDFPFSFYAVLASHRLGTLPPMPVPQIAEPVFPETRLGRELQAAYRLAGVSLEESQSILDYISQTEVLPSDHETLLAILWNHAGDHHQALKIADKRDLMSLSPNDAIITAFFPLAYPVEIKTGYLRTSLPEGVIEGIMREESRFLTKVRSSAGAVGLMQLMPATAAMQARKLGLSGFHTQKLEDPETNILLGSTFFEKMMNDFRGQMPLAIMAYNAGPGNVRKWLRTQGHLPLDEFIEEIPFSETRGYVKRVLSSIQVYGHLRQSPELQKPFFSMKL